MRAARLLPAVLGLALVPVAPAFGQRRAPERPTSTLVWGGTAVDVGGTVSPDGRYVSYTDWSTGDLALRDLTADTGRVVVAANNAKGGRVKVFAEVSTISRDGRRVAYSRYDEGRGRYELWIAELHGDAKARRVYGGPTVDWLAPRDWSPDGRWIAAVFSTSDLTQQIALVPTAGGDVRIVRSYHRPGSTRVFFSPDGRYLAYDLPQDSVGAHDVWVSAVDGSQAQGQDGVRDVERDVLVVAHRAHDVAMGWSPDGRYLLFSSDRTGSTALFGVEMHHGAARGLPVALKPDLGLAESLGVTRGGALYWGALPGRRGGSIQVARFDLETGATAAPRDVSPSPQEDNVNPSWSPDGRHLAYVSNRGRAGDPVTIVLRTADAGGLVREIEPKLHGAQLAGWHPDGRSVLLVGRDLGGRNGVFRLDLATGAQSLVFATPYAPTLSLPALSTDGRVLYYWNRLDGGGDHVFVARDLATGVEQELVRRPFLGAILLSPDGRHIATESVDPRTNARVVLLVPTDGAAPRELMGVASGVAPNDLRRVTGTGARVAPASWAPGGQSLVAKLQREPEGPGELWHVPVDGGAPRRLPAPLEPSVFAFRVSPDGRRVAYRIKEAEPPLPKQVWSFEHFIPAKDGSK